VLSARDIVTELSSRRVTQVAGDWGNKAKVHQGAEAMELRNIVMTKITIQPNVVEKERSKSVLAPAEIRLRAFEIHIERGGIHRLDLDTCQQAGANFEKTSTTREEKQQRNEIRHRDDIEIREGSVTVKLSSLLACYHILRAQHHWTAFQAIRYALWLAR
jgi:hypothetical protein